MSGISLLKCMLSTLMHCLIQQESNGSSYCQCVFNLFNEIKQNDYGCDSIREIMIRTSQMFLTSTSLAIPSKWIKSLIRDHIQFGTVTIYMKGLFKNLSTNISINNYKCSLYNKLKKQT